MATIKLSNEAASAKAAGHQGSARRRHPADLHGGGPATADDAETGTLLAEFDLASPAFGTPANGVMTATRIADVTALADGTAAYWRAYGAGSPANVICQGTAGTSGTSMILNSTTFTTGGVVSIVSWTYTQPKAMNGDYLRRRTVGGARNPIARILVPFALTGGTTPPPGRRSGRGLLSSSARAARNPPCAVTAPSGYTALGQLQEGRTERGVDERRPTG